MCELFTGPEGRPLAPLPVHGLLRAMRGVERVFEVSRENQRNNPE